MLYRTTARRRTGRARRLALALLLATGVAAWSSAPARAQTTCSAGAECQAIDQPALPAWLTLSGASAYYAGQTIDGVAADEYGSTADADPALYSSATNYGAAPALGTKVVDAVLDDVDGTDPGGTDAFVLESDRTLAVLGPQSSGYPQRAASVSVPGSDPLVGVTALTSPSGTTRVIVVTATGFDVYDWVPGPPARLILEAGMPSSELHLGTGGFGYYGVLDDPAFGNDSSSDPLMPGPPFFAIPSGEHIVAMYQPPPGKGTVTPSIAGGAGATFALAYTGTSRDVLGRGDGSYTVAMLGLFDDGIHPVNEFQSISSDAAGRPMAISYAISDGYYHVAAVAPGSAGPPQMTEFDTSTVAGGHNSPLPATLVNGATSQACAATGDGGVPRVATDASTATIFGPTQTLGTGVSVCASLTGDDAHAVRYVVERTDLIRPAVGQPDEISSTSTSPSDLALPAGVRLADVSVDFPCNEFLAGFAAHPLDGFPDTSANANYCENGLAPDGEASQMSTGRELTPRSSVAVNLETAAVDATGAASLNLTSVSYGTPGACLNLPLNAVGCENDTPLSDTTAPLAALPGGAPAGLLMLPLDPRDVVLDEQLVTDKTNQVVQTAASANPVPVALMAAPPYYAGGSQQITPTSTSFTGSSCSSSGTSQSNQAGVFGGVDVTWASDKYEIEALAKIESSWTSSISLETCSGFEQQFLAGNFGNNFAADNSLLFHVDAGVNTYGNVTRSSLGVNLTPGCDTNDLLKCAPIFVPQSTKYVLQTLTQLKHPQPNNVFAADDRQLQQEYGSALAATAPDPGNPASYPAETGTPPVGENACSGPAGGAGSFDPGIQDTNPFVAPTPPAAPNVLQAGQATDVDPASGGDEAGTVSTLSFDSTTTQSSSTEFSIGAEVSAKIVYAKFGADYAHAWGTDMSQSFGSGTSFSGGVNDFQGFFNPYRYRLYECRAKLDTSPQFGTGFVPIFLLDYTTSETADELPLNFVTPNLPTGVVGQDYAGTVFASGGLPDYSYSVAKGALPPGLTLNAGDGQISGTPTADGTFALTIKATDQGANTSVEDVTITIAPALTLASTLAAGDVGVPYSSSLAAAGGVQPYTYLLTTDGTLAPGLRINNSAGTVEGTPTAAGTYCFGVYVADSNFPASTLTAQPCVTIGAAPALDTSGHTLPVAEAGRPFSATLCCASGGSAPYTWAVQGLPAGLRLDAGTGAITGTPLAATAAAGVDLQPDVTDAAGAVAGASATLRVLPAPAITTASLPPGSVGSAYTPQVTVTGGDGANQFALQAVGGGAAPPGIAIGAASGAFGGTPTTAGTYSFSVVATDGHGGVATRTYTVRIDSAGGAHAPALTSPNSATVAVGAPLAFAITSSGSPAPATAETGALPAGIAFTDQHDGTASLTGVPAPGSAGTYPLTLRADNGISPATSQPFTLTVTAPAVPVPGAAGIWVANGGADSVTEYAPGASGNAAPVATLAGAHTGLAEPAGVALDAQGDVYVANAGSHAVTEYAPGASGDAAPIATLAGTYTQPGGLTVAGDGTVYVADGTAIATVRNGTTHAIADADGAAAVALDTAGNVFAANAHSVTAYAAGLTGSPPALTTLAGSGTGLATPTGVALDGAGDAFVSSDGSGLDDSVDEYAPGATGSVPPLLALAGAHTGLAQPSAVALDPSGGVLVSNRGDDSVTAYAPGASGDAAPARTISGGATGLDAPSALFVGAAPYVRLQPVAGAPVAPGATVTLTSTITAAPACALQWRVSSGGGAPFADVAGATAPTLTLTGVPAGHDGYIYEATCANSFGSVATDPVTLAVQSPAATLTDPADETVTAGDDATFTAAARGYPAPAVQWQRSGDGGATFADVPGATAATLTVPAVPAAADGDRFRAVFTNAAGSATTAAATLTVHSAPVLATQPLDAAAVPGAAVTFSARATGNPAPSVRWQVSTDAGLSFSDVAGATAETLTIAQAASQQDGYRFRAVFSNAVGDATSAAATLSVDSAPAVVQDPTDVNALAGDDAGFHALASGSPTPAVQWQVSHDGGATFTDVPGATTSDLDLPAAAVALDGTRYRARFSNPAGTTLSRAATLHVRAVTAGGTLGASASNTTNTTIVNGATVVSGSPEALVKVRNTVIRVGRRGRHARDVDVKLYCSPRAGHDCKGTVKIRSHGVVNPSPKCHPHCHAQRVTFVTFGYSLRRGAYGTVTGALPASKFRLLERLHHLSVDALVQVTDADGKVEFVRATVPMKTVRVAG